MGITSLFRLEMIDGICEEQTTLSGIKNSKIQALLPKIDFPMLHKLKHYLLLFRGIRLYVSSQSKPTLCKVLVGKYTLELVAKKLFQSRELAPIKAKFDEAISLKFAIFPVHYAATFLWQRYKGNSNLFDSEKYDIAFKEIERIYDKISPFQQNRSTSSPSSQANNDEISIHDLLEIGEEQRQEEKTLREEFEMYRSLQLSVEHKEMEIFSFWDLYRNLFPKLALVAYRVHVIPATNNSCERHFNYCNCTVTKRRCNLSPVTTGQLMIIQNNPDKVPELEEFLYLFDQQTRCQADDFSLSRVLKQLGLTINNM